MAMHNNPGGYVVARRDHCLPWTLPQGFIGLSSGHNRPRNSPEDFIMSDLKPLKIDIVSDVVCPWCYIGKKRIEDALALVPDVPVEVNWRPFFLNPWVPREGI